MRAVQVAHGLGVFSLCLGLAELLAPKRIGGYLGMEHRSRLLRVYGLREIGSGAGILARSDPSPGVWARVGGDALDLAALGTELVSGNNTRKSRVAVATAAIASITAIDIVTARQLSDAGQRRAGSSRSGVKTVDRTVTIGKSPDELYRLWRDSQTLPRVMHHAAAITVTDATHAHWKVDAPLGRTFEWDTEIVEDRPGELVRWKSLPGDAIPNEGSVTFRPGPRDWGTEVSLGLTFSPPGGLLGAATTVLPDAISKVAVSKALYRFKSLAETGEIPRTDPHPPPVTTRADAQGVHHARSLLERRQ